MTPLEIARDYSSRGWAPLPIPHRSKRIVVEDWTSLKIIERDLPKHFNNTPQNVGVLLGVWSNGLIDIDLDHPVAMELAPQYLPPTGAIFGRKGKPKSHWIYKCSGPSLATRKFEFKLRDHGQGGMVVEVRGMGAQTVFPGSTHESGEAIEWHSDDDPFEIEYDELVEAVGQLYEAVLDYVLIRIHLDFDEYNRLKLEPPPGLSVEERAIRYLETMPGAISGQGGHAATFRAARALVWLFDLPPDKALELLAGHFNPRCQPEWKLHQLEHKIRDADRLPFDRPRGCLKDAEDPRYQESDFGKDVVIDLPPAEPSQFLTLHQLWSKHPKLREPVIHGLLRRGEVMNIVSATKVGKSWLVNDLALSIASGNRWLETFQCEPGRVLIIDNELHPETSASRTELVVKAKGITDPEIIGRVSVDNIRGKLIDLIALDKYLAKVVARQFDLIILDAFYRFAIDGTDENDNHAMAVAYNRLDALAARLDCGIGLIHHSSKGSQSGKGVTDVGAGAGSQSRAADSHVVIRHHKDDGVVVLDAAVRSWQPVKPICLRFDFPLWYPDKTLDPSELRPDRPRREKKPALGAPLDAGSFIVDVPASKKMDAAWFARECCTDHPSPVSRCEEIAMEKGASQTQATRLRKNALEQELIFDHSGRFDKTKLISRTDPKSILPK